MEDQSCWLVAKLENGRDLSGTEGVDTEIKGYNDPEGDCVSCPVMLAKQLQSEIQNKEKEEEPPIQKQPQSPV